MVQPTCLEGKKIFSLFFNLYFLLYSILVIIPPICYRKTATKCFVLDPQLTSQAFIPGSTTTIPEIELFYKFMQTIIHMAQALAISTIPAKLDIILISFSNLETLNYTMINCIQSATTYINNTGTISRLLNYQVINAYFLQQNFEITVF